MPKLKTNRAAAKRFKATGSGKLKRRRAYLRHILTHKTRKQKRRLGRTAMVDAADLYQLQRLMPYC